MTVQFIADYDDSHSEPEFVKKHESELIFDLEVIPKIGENVSFNPNADTQEYIVTGVEYVINNDSKKLEIVNIWIM